LAGGGAEILNDNVRAKICPQKINSATWLSVHQTAHHTGIKSNATMLYGHVETYAHRIEHLAQLRTLQDQTHGFNAFIPLKYRKLNSAMPVQTEVGLQEDCRNMAVCRIFLDNIPHLKAYLPALGKDAIATMLQCGADDLDGTMYDGTKIYAPSGNAAAPAITIDELQQVCTQAGYRLRERNSEYVLSEFLFELDGCVAKS
jgi:aminodeoxyfutalosine synthase